MPSSPRLRTGWEGDDVGRVTEPRTPHASDATTSLEPRGHPTGSSLVRLSSHAGNRAVSSLMGERRQVERDGKGVSISRNSTHRDSAHIVRASGVVAGVGHTVQREPDPNLDAARKEWDDHKAIHLHFTGGFDSGTNSYMDLRSLYQAKGISNPAAYLDAHIVTLSFFGHSTPGHDDLTAKLSAAAATLNAGSIVPTIASFWAFVPRRMASGSLSNHALGRAIDINPSSNPHVINKSDILVVESVTGVDLGASQTAADMRAASQTFQTDFTAAWKTQKQTDLDTLKALVTPTDDQKAEIARLTKLLGAIKARSTTLDSYAAKGFLDIEQTLVDALVVAGFGWGGDYRSSKDFMHFEVI